MERWREMYRQKLSTPDKAVGLINDGDFILVGLINSLPPALVSAVARKAKTGLIRNATFMEALNLRSTEIYAPEVISNINVVSGYAAINRSILMTSADIDFQPIRLAEAKKVLENRVNVLMFTVSPMDKHGFFSAGINPDYICGVAKSGQPYKILVEVNEKMPKTFGNNHFHITEVASIVENTQPLFSLPQIPVSKEDEAIGNYIAEQIPDGACIQLGIGGVPNAVGNALATKKDLGVHSEMICDSMMELYHAGVITCRKKNHMPGKWMGAFVLGSEKLYDFVSENPMIEMWSADTVNDPRISSINDKLMAINTTLQVDLSGQCASETIAYRQYSGVGGNK